MSFEMEKCSQVVRKRGKAVRTDCTTRRHHCRHREQLQYLGIQQASGNHEDFTRKTKKPSKYLQRKASPEESAESEQSTTGEEKSGFEVSVISIFPNFSLFEMWFD